MIIELGNYQADSWRHGQRLILVVIDRPDPVTGQMKLVPDYSLDLRGIRG